MAKQPYMIERGSDAKELPALYPGMLMEVLSSNNRLIFVGRIEWMKDRSLQIVDDSGVALPYIEYNSVIKLRGFYHSQAVVLEGVIAGSTDQFWRVEKLRSLQASERRQFFRQSTNIEVRAMCLNEIFEARQPGSGRGAVPVDCRIIDISAGGVMIRTREGFQVGDWVFLMDVKIIPDEPGFALTCRVRRVIEQGRENDYGCQFCEMDNKEQDRLIRGILYLQRKELQARRKGYDIE